MDSVARPSRYRDAVSRAGRVFWLASQRDLVLRYAFPVGDLVASILFGGYTQSALGLVGPRPCSAMPLTTPRRCSPARSTPRIGNRAAREAAVSSALPARDNDALALRARTYAARNERARLSVRRGGRRARTPDSGASREPRDRRASDGRARRRV